MRNPANDPLHFFFGCSSGGGGLPVCMVRDEDRVSRRGSGGRLSATGGGGGGGGTVWVSRYSWYLPRLTAGSFFFFLRGAAEVETASSSWRVDVSVISFKLPTAMPMDAGSSGAVTNSDGGMLWALTCSRKV